MNFVFDNTYVFNSDVYRDIGDVYAVYNSDGSFAGYRAIAKKLVNNKEICSASFPCDPTEMTGLEIIRALRS